MTSDQSVDLEALRRENERRHAALHAPYDPLTGLGGCGERVRHGDLWLPRTLLAACPHYDQLSPLEQERCRIAHDFDYWCVRCVKVRDKLTGRNVPLHLNAPQRRVAALMERERQGGRPLRVILLKARQWGGSTLVQMYMAWMQLVHHRNWNSVICGHLLGTARAIKSMYRRLVRHYPRELLDPDVKHLEFRNFEGSSQVQELSGRDCLVIMGTAMSEDAVRGFDVAMAHLSEVAFWKESPMHHPTDVIRSVSGSVAVAADTVVVLESTANGVGTFFHREWLRAKAGESDKLPVFVPWHEIEIYRRPVDDVAQLWASLDDYEQALWHQHGLTLEMINWYHHKRREYTSHEQMQAEFPTTDLEAFASAGYGVFSLEALSRLRAGCRSPLFTGEVMCDDKAPRFVAAPAGCLQIWASPAPSARYVVAVDVGGRTEGADFSVIVVVDTHHQRHDGVAEVVAQWRGHVDHDLLARKAMAMARHYNKALLVVESNTLESGDDASHYVLDCVLRNYERLYVRSTNRPGYHTNSQTKPVAVGLLITAVRDGTWVERDAAAVDEMAIYEQVPGGAMAARAGGHDDMVMARAIALHVIAERNLAAPPAITPTDKQHFIGHYGKL